MWNWIDLVIIVLLLGFTVSGYFRGFIRQAADFAILVVAIFASVWYYGPLSGFISANLSMPQTFARVAAFFAIWVLVQFVLNILVYFLYPKIPEFIRKSMINRIFGAVPGFLWGVLVLAIVLSLFVALPIKNRYKDDILASNIGSNFVSRTSGMEKYVSNIFGGAINDTLTFLTVKPNSGETIDLGYKTTDVTVDSASEEKMLGLVNAERAKQGLAPLEMDEKLREVARAHSRDMFARGYFAHTDPDGKDPFARLRDAGIDFAVAGENLALAPNVDLAHQGLMNSPGHRANILTAEFGKVGIGCIDGGKYGKMFSQEFTN